MTILVTGGAGFIGSNFVLDWLAHTDEPVVNVDKLTYAGNLRNLSALEGDARHFFLREDICDGSRMLDIIATHRPRAVINFAAESHVDRSIAGPEEFIQTNVVGCFRLLEAVRKASTGFSGAWMSSFRFVQVSTDEVYGSLTPSAPAFSEANRFEPNSPYSASKAAADHLARAYWHTYGLPTVTTNCSNNYGAFHFPEKLIPLCINNALAGLPLPLYGDGRQVRDWLFVRDHCAALRVVLERGIPGETYNIGGKAEFTNLEVVQMICDILDELRPDTLSGSYRRLITFVKDRPGHDRRYAIDASKIESQLGWYPRVAFRDGLRQTIEWYLDNEDWVSGITSGAYRDWIRRQYGSGE